MGREPSRGMEGADPKTLPAALVPFILASVGRSSIPKTWYDVTPLAAPMDTLTELRRLGDDLTSLGDPATAAVVRKGIDGFNRRQFEAGERWLETASGSGAKVRFDLNLSGFIDTGDIGLVTNRFGPARVPPGPLG